MLITWMDRGVLLARSLVGQGEKLSCWRSCLAVSNGVSRRSGLVDEFTPAGRRGPSKMPSISTPLVPYFCVRAKAMGICRPPRSCAEISRYHAMSSVRVPSCMLRFASDGNRSAFNLAMHFLFLYGDATAYADPQLYTHTIIRTWMMLKRTYPERCGGFVSRRGR